MHLRFPLWSALLVFAVVTVLRAQTPPATPALPAGTAAAPAMQEGQIVAKKVTGKVSVLLNGGTTELHENDHVSQASTIITGNDSSVILVFSNGATTQLGADTTLVIEEFMQDPFQQNVSVGALTEEPTRSHTKLHLTKGELLGKVAHLKYDEGSYFTVQTPVGAAGIRGTTFRIVFRPTGTGQAFAVFSLSTLEGNVNFQQGGTGAPGTQGSAQPPGPTTPGQPQGQATPNGVPVVTGQEVVVNVNVEVNPQTGVAVVTTPSTVSSTQPISVETTALLTRQAEVVATTAAQTTFTPTPPAPTTSTTNPSTEPEKKDDKKSDDKKSDNTGSSTGTTSGDGTTGTASTGTTSTTTSTTTSSTAANNTGATTTNSVVTPASPPPATNLPVLTPGAGKSAGG